MAKNEYKPVETQEPVKEKERVKKVRESRLTMTFRSILNGEILTREAVLRLLPFGLYITFLTILYIANSYNYEKNIRRTLEIRNQLIELQYEYITTKSDLMHISQQSEIAKKLDSLETGIEESIVPPLKIFVKKQPDSK
jgi:hypothetical protein